MKEDFVMDKDFDDFSFDSDWKPQNMNFDTFQLRNDPSNLLKEIKFYLMNVEEIIDDKDSSKKKLVRKKDFFTKKELKPIVNQQGVEEIMMALKPIINNHNVMGNTSSENFHVRRMY